MKVYTVTREYEGIQGIFSTKRRANAYIKQLVKYTNEGFYVTTIELDVPGKAEYGPTTYFDRVEVD